MFRYWRTTVPEWHSENDAIAELWREHPEGSRQLVLSERTEDPRQTHILKRGDFLQPDRAVAPGVPAFLHPLPAGAPLNRLTFAKWLVARESPTTARSIVNHVWQSHFGAGIVATVENLGTQAEAPSNQQLLDWLAVEFMDPGWSLKKLQRLITTSAAYRQSSNVTPDLLSRDPDKRLVARGPRFRVDAEIVRDIALAASGLLNSEIGGPSVYPPAPAFLFLPSASYGPNFRHEPSHRATRRLDIPLLTTALPATPSSGQILAQHHSTYRSQFQCRTWPSYFSEGGHHHLAAASPATLTCARSYSSRQLALAHPVCLP